MSHQRPNTRTNSRGYPIRSNWTIKQTGDGDYQCGNPACGKEFSAWNTRGNKTNPVRRISLAMATARRHADTCTKETP